MRTTMRKFSTVSALLLFAVACPANAMPPLPHAFKGTIEATEGRTRELVITNGIGRVVLVWNDATRFGGACASPGAAVKAYYRKEAGRLVARDVRAWASKTCARCCY